MKKCYKCGIAQELSCFQKDRTKKDGLQSKCKTCTRARNASYHAVHREYFVEHGKRRYKDAKEADPEFNAKRYKARREAFLEGRKRQSRSPRGRRPAFAAEAVASRIEELPPCHWSRSTALDPKHRPQEPHRPSSTVRREWCRFPQEAHLLDLKGNRYRRLLGEEVAALQGFPADWASEAVVPELDLIRGYGNAVPPALAEVLLGALRDVADGTISTGIEICAGFGGMALGAHRALGLEHKALIEIWEPAAKVLRHRSEWSPSAVVLGDVLQFPWQEHAGEVDLLSGGLPCQPWSNAGKGLGAADMRDLLGAMPDVVARLQPRAFVFENVPGLLAGENEPYAAWLIKQLRSPSSDLKYGVAAAVFNAADFGVPQVRRRVFIVGLIGKEDRDVHAFFDKVAARRTHADPRLPLPAGRAPWRTVADAVPDWSDVRTGWRRWLGQANEEGADAESAGSRRAADAAPAPVRAVSMVAANDKAPVGASVVGQKAFFRERP